MIRTFIFIACIAGCLQTHGQAPGTFSRAPGTGEQAFGSSRRAPGTGDQAPRSGTSTLRVLFTGDIMGHDTQIASALATGEEGYDYRPCFEHLTPYLTNADLVIGNLEVTLAGPPYKGYPRFSSPDELADALKETGFHILLTANNHALDRGKEGFVRTRQQLDRRGLLHTGAYTGDSLRQRFCPLVVEKNGIRLALLNYTYGTNGLNVKPPMSVNRIDRSRIQDDLRKAAGAGPDITIVAMHWGTEYEREESEAQRDLAAFLFRYGADVVIGSHPHVVQPIRGTGRGDLVVFSLGNFISNQRNRFRDGGIVFELELLKEGGNTRVAETGYLPVWVYKPVTQKGTLFTLVPAAVPVQIQDQLNMPGRARIKMVQFLTDTRALLTGIREFEPYWME